MALEVILASTVETAPGHMLLLLGSFVCLLIGAEIFTNGIEWLGHRLGVSESATGSILAAVGTALPETMIPVIAILGGTTSGEGVAVGAILGAPFMLATIAMFLIGASLLYFQDRRVYGGTFQFNELSTARDLKFFLIGYTLAFFAALFPRGPLTIMIAIGLMLLYAVYVYRSIKAGDTIEDEGLNALHLGNVIEKGASPITQFGSEGTYANDPSRYLVIGQTIIALAIIIGGAHLFVAEIRWGAHVVGVPSAILSLILAPLATELPEKFNSVLWISRDKDTLAIGNITGAMAFQSTLPVTLGIMYTSWNLSLQWGTEEFLYGLSALLAIVSGAILYIRVRSAGSGNMTARPFFIGGAFYLTFIAILVYHVIVFNIQATRH